MRINGISAWHVDLPLHEGSYKWSGGKSVEVVDSTIVSVTTDAGLVGWGEVCPLGPFYLPAYAAGARAGIAELGPHLLGERPLEIERLNQRMDAALKGHRLLGHPRPGGGTSRMRVAGRPVGRGLRSLPRDLAGGAGGDGKSRGGVSQRGLSALPAQGGWRPRRRHGAYPGRSRAARAWRQARVARGVSDVDVYIEQPCASYEECLSVRRHTDHPFVLDEIIDGVNMLLRGHRDLAMDVVNLKIGKFGGLTRARQARDLCVRLGIAMTIEDSWGGDITTAAIAHLAHSTPTEFLFTATDFNSYVTVSTAEGAPQRVNGRMAASTAPGLGVTPRMEVLGDAVVEVR